MQCGQHGRQSDAPGALDIVIEAGDLGLILVEDSFGILETKVLTVWVSYGRVGENIEGTRSQVDVGIWEALASDLDKFVHKFIIFFATHTTFA